MLDGGNQQQFADAASPVAVCDSDRNDVRLIGRVPRSQEADDGVGSPVLVSPCAESSSRSWRIFLHDTALVEELEGSFSVSPSRFSTTQYLAARFPSSRRKDVGGKRVENACFSTAFTCGMSASRSGRTAKGHDSDGQDSE